MTSFSSFNVNGKTYFTVRHASTGIGDIISHGTLALWVKKGRTPWDLDLDIVCQPVRIHAKGRQTAKRLEPAFSSAKNTRSCSIGS
jgi:hypothetical protein